MKTSRKDGGKRTTRRGTATVIGRTAAPGPPSQHLRDNKAMPQVPRKLVTCHLTSTSLNCLQHISISTASSTAQLRTRSLYSSKHACLLPTPPPLLKFDRPETCCRLLQPAWPPGPPDHVIANHPSVANDDHGKLPCLSSTPRHARDATPPSHSPHHPPLALVHVASQA